MKYQVDSERMKEVEFESSWVDRLMDLIQAEELVIKLTGWSVNIEMPHWKPYFLAYREVGAFLSSLVLLLHVILFCFFQAGI